MHIGDFGVIEREVEASAGDASTAHDTFTWFGEKIRLRIYVSPYDLIKFTRVIRRKQSDFDMFLEAMSHLEGWILPDDWAKFEDLADQNGADAELLAKVLMEVYGVLGERPTKRSSDSSNGRPAEETTEPSNVKSSATSRASKRAASSARPRKKAAATG